MSLLKRRFFLGSNAVIVTAFTFVSFGFIFSISKQFRNSVDLSAASLNTLESETISQLRLIDAENIPIKITAFTAQSGRNDAYRKNLQVKDFLKRLSSESSLIEWEQVDYDKDRFTAEDLGVNEYGKVVIQRGEARIDLKERTLFRMQSNNGQRVAHFIGEPEFSRAIGNLLSDELPVIYILTGHGEPNIKSVGPKGLSDLTSRIERDGYVVKATQIIYSEQGGTPDIPSDAKLLLIVGPKSAITSIESSIISSYLDRGGAVLYLGDTDSPLPSFVSDLGIEQPEGVAVDEKTLFPYWDRPIPVVLQHPSTQDVLNGEYTMVLSHPAAFVLPASANFVINPLMRLGRNAWLDRGGDLTGGIARFDQGIDLKIDMVQGVAISLPTGGNLALFSDSEWVQNQMINEIPAAEPLIMGLIYYLTGEERRLGNRPVDKAQPTVQITKPEMANVRLVSMIPLPLLIGLFGFWAWYKRRAT